MMNVIVRLATTAGNDHKQPNNPGAINNQDAVEPIILTNGKIIGGVVCDGCSAKPYSDIGARFGATMIARILSEKLSNSSEINWEELTREVVDGIIRKAPDFSKVGEAVNETISNNFLFTIMIAVAIENKILIACCGDGIIRVDDEIQELENLIQNTPAYIVYRAIPSPFEPNSIGIRLVKEIDLSKITKGVIVGTDGLKKLAKANDAIFHPSLMINETAMQIWLQGRVYDVKSLYLGDDISVIRFSTDVIQERMLQERNEINIFRAKITELQSQMKVLQQSYNDLIQEKNRISCELAKTKSDLKIEKMKPRFTLFGHPSVLNTRVQAGATLPATKHIPAKNDTTKRIVPVSPATASVKSGNTVVDGSDVVIPEVESLDVEKGTNSDNKTS